MVAAVLASILASAKASADEMRVINSNALKPVLRQVARNSKAQPGVTLEDLRKNAEAFKSSAGQFWRARTSMK
jgi:hypothetical protein